MLIVGWADGYRNNSFRVIEQYERNGLPWRLLAGPWVHKSPERARPGPNVDDDVDVLAFFDRHLGDGDDDRRRAAGRCTCAGRCDPSPTWCSTRAAGSTSTRGRRRNCATCAFGTGRDGVDALAVEGDVGVAAWNSCGGGAAVGAAARPARRQRPLAHLRLAGRRTGGVGRHRARVAAGAVGSRLRACQRQALRRPPRRLVGADHARHARPAPSRLLAGRSARRGRARSPSPWSRASGSTS